MNFKAVIFDLDGTLLNTIDDLTDTVNAMLTQQGHPNHSIEDFKFFIGDGSRLMLTRSLPEGFRDEASVSEAEAIFKAEYQKRYDNKTKAYDGILELLEAIAALKIPMAVFSNKPHEPTLKCVRKFLPEELFTIVFGQREGVPTKPDPAGALEIADLLGVSPAECLYLGDTDTDMKTAVSSGMYAVGVLWGFRSCEELIDNGAKAVVQHPSEILRLLQSA